MENDLFVASLIMYATKKEWSPPLTVELRKAMQDGDVTMDFVLKSLDFVILKKIVQMGQMKTQAVINSQTLRVFLGMVCDMKNVLSKVITVICDS